MRLRITREAPEMPDNRAISRSRVSQAKSDPHQVFSPQQNLRPGNRYLTEVTDGDGDYCVVLCALPAGAVVPMHSHADRETFYVVSGNPDVFHGDRWQTLGPGDVIDAQDGVRHAWKNASAAACSMLCVTTMRMGRFLRDVAVEGGSADPRADAQRFLRLVREHGYWLASPEQNAAIGLEVHWGADGAAGR
jgi:quercetin dioxygenase-like cupin family protein